MWVRAVWVEKGREEEGVIPSVWLEDKTVRWPKGITAMRDLNNQEKPSKDWHIFPLRKIKCTSGTIGGVYSVYRKKDSQISHNYNFYCSNLRITTIGYG